LLTFLSPFIEKFRGYFSSETHRDAPSHKLQRSVGKDKDLVFWGAVDMVTGVASAMAERLKEDGNNCFKKERFGAAIDAYTEAIALSPNVPAYWTNRALCHMKRKDWTKVEEDCRKAIQLVHNSVKV
jgi:tetratricopeptide (TPR) repeat protein